jgi:hypothetical protein
MRRPKTALATQSRDRLRFESLEPRELLAADAATGLDVAVEVVGGTGDFAVTPTIEVVTCPDCIVPGPVFDESIVTAGDGRDDGEIVACLWLSAEADFGINDVTAEGGGEHDVAVPRVTMQAAPETTAAGGSRAWGAFFPALGTASGSPDAAAGLQSPGQPGTGRPRIRLPFRPVV